MDTEQNYWRIKFAKFLFERIEALDEINAAFIGGSVCRGYADEYSDLEICFVWEKQIEENDRLLVNEQLNVNSFDVRYVNNKINQIEDSTRFKDLQIDIYHTNKEYIEIIINDVLCNHDISFEKMNYLNIIEYAIPLYGKNIISTWKQKVKKYPNKLSELIIQKHISKWYGL